VRTRYSVHAQTYTKARILAHRENQSDYDFIIQGAPSKL